MRIREDIWCVICIDAVLPTTMVYTVQEVLTQVRLLWLHSGNTAYHLLSRNVVREVCTYLQGHTALAFFTDANIEIHHLATQTVRKAKPSKVVKFCVTTHMTFREIICVGAYPKSTSVSSVDLTTSTVTKEASMQVSRACPGIINVRGHIYVFGGLIDGEDVLRCEKFSIKARQWTSPASTSPPPYTCASSTSVPSSKASPFPPSTLPPSSTPSTL